MNLLGKIAIVAIIAICAPNFSSGASISRIHHRVARQLSIPREFQSIRVENYLKNPRAVKFQLNCLVYNGPCDTIGKYLKNNVHQWLHTQCDSCDPETKKLAGKLIGFFQRGYPKEWNDAVTKYKGEFSEDEAARFEEEFGLTMYAVIPEAGSPGKIDFEGLSAVVKEAKEVFLEKSKNPVILTQGGVQLTTPRGFDIDAALKRVESLADKHLPTLVEKYGQKSSGKMTAKPTSFTTTTTPTTTTTTTTTTTEAPSPAKLVMEADENEAETAATEYDDLTTTGATTEGE